MSLGEAVVSSLLQRVIDGAIDAAVNEFKLIKNVRKEVEKLCSTLSIIKIVLQDAEEKQSGNDGVRIWLGRLKQIVYDADDVLDEYATDSALRSRSGGDVAGQINWKAKVYMMRPLFKSLLVVHYNDTQHDGFSLKLINRTTVGFL